MAMRKVLLAALALSAVLGAGACKQSEQEQDATHVPSPAAPAVAPAPITADSSVARDTSTTTRL